MATASIMKEANPDYLRHSNLTMPYGKLVDMFGAPVTPHNIGNNHPVSWKNLVDLFKDEQAMPVQERVRAYIERWNSWHSRTLALVKTNNLNEITASWIEFEPELPARLSHFVPVPIIDHTEVQKRAKFFMYGIGALFEWGSLATDAGQELYEKSMVSIASNITLLFKLFTHAALWKAKMEVSRIMQLTGLPYMNGWAYERLQAPGYGFGVLHADPRGLIAMASAVSNTMNDTMKSDFSFMVLNSRLKGLLSEGNPTELQDFRNANLKARVDAQGFDAVKSVMGKPIVFEQDYVYRGRTEAPDEPMTVKYTCGAFWVSDNAYLKSYAESPYYVNSSSGFGNTILAPPNTNDFRALRFLNLSKGDVDWDTISVHELIENCLCYDQKDPMLPLRRKMYQDLAKNHAQYAANMGMHLPSGPNKGEKQVSIFVYADRQGVHKAVGLWGQLSRVYMNDQFLQAAVRVARTRVVQAIGGEDKIQAINRMTNVLDLAYSRNSQMPTQNTKDKYYFEAFCYAVANHAPNANPGSWILKANEFGVVDLPDLVGKAISFKDATGADKFVEVTVPGGAGGAVTFATLAAAGGGAAPIDAAEYTATGLPHGFCTIGHAQTIVRAKRANEIKGWMALEDFAREEKVLEDGLEALDLYVDRCIDFFGAKFDSRVEDTMTPTLRKTYENLFHSSAVLPLYLRSNEGTFGSLAKRNNLMASIFESTWCGINRAPLFFDISAFAAAVAKDFPSVGLGVSNEERALALHANLVGGTPPAGGELMAWRALAFALDQYLANSSAASDLEQGFPNLKDKWRRVNKDVSVGDFDNPATRDTLGGWINYELTKHLLPSATAGDGVILAGLVAGKGAGDMTTALADANVAELTKEATILAKTIGGVYQSLTRNAGIGVKFTVDRRWLDTLPRQYAGMEVRGTGDYSKLAASEAAPRDAPSGYVNLRMSVAPTYFSKARANQDYAYGNPLRPADPHQDFMKPLAPRRGSQANAASLATMGHGAADNSIVHTWTGDAAINNYRKTPAITERQPDLRPLSRITGTMGYGDYEQGPLPSYFQWDMLAEIGECPDMVARLKTASSYNDKLSRSLAFQFLGQPVYGKKQQEWAALNIPVFLCQIVIAHRVRFDMHCAYFLNDNIGQLYYGYNESAISCDLIHFKMTVQVRFFAATLINNENRMMIAPHVAYRRMLGGIDKTFITRVGYDQEEADVDFDIHRVDLCRKSLFVLPMGPSQTTDNLGEVISLVARARDTSDLRQYYGSDSSFVSTKNREPTFPSAFEFNVMTQYYKAGAAQRNETTPYSLLRVVGDNINDMAYVGPQLIKQSEDGKLKHRKGGGPFKHMCPGIKDSLMGGSRIFSPYGTPLGSVATLSQECY